MPRPREVCSRYFLALARTVASSSSSLACPRPATHVVSIVVALNKCDKHGVNKQRVL
jgi:hypothetical protein